MLNQCLNLQEEFNYALNILDQIVSVGKNGSHDDKKETTKDGICATLSDDASTNATALRITQQNYIYSPEEHSVGKENHVCKQNAARQAVENQNDEEVDTNLVADNLNEVTSCASEERGNDSDLIVVAKQRQSCNKTYNHEPGCYDNELEPITDGHNYNSSVCLSNDASNTSRRQSENNGEPTTGSQPNGSGFSHSLPGIGKAMSQQSSDICASKTSELEENVTKTNEGNESRVMTLIRQKSGSPKDSQTRKEPDSSLQELDTNVRTSTSNVHCDNKVEKNLESTNDHLKVDATNTDLGLPVDEPVVCGHVMNNSTPSNEDSSDEEDLEEFFDSTNALNE